MKILKHLYKYLWIYTTILLLIFIVIIKILEMNNLAFRIYILITMTIIIEVPNEEEYTLNEKRYIVHTGGFLIDTEIVIYEYINDFVYKIPSLYTDFVSGGYDSIYNIYNYVPNIPQ